MNVILLCGGAFKPPALCKVGLQRRPAMRIRALNMRTVGAIAAFQELTV